MSQEISAPIGTVPADIELSMTTATAGQYQTFRLSDYRGQAVVLYFYPKDSTPGCTNEAIDFRDHYTDFVAANTVIFGISRDSLKSHDSFKSKLGLPFELISDPDELLCAQFNVIKQKMMYGKSVRGIERSTFVLNRDGEVAREWRKVKVEQHVTDVLSFVQTVNR